MLPSSNQKSGERDIDGEAKAEAELELEDIQMASLGQKSCLTQTTDKRMGHRIKTWDR
jgi:hypothetical protein